MLALLAIPIVEQQMPGTLTGYKAGILSGRVDIEGDAPATGLTPIPRDPPASVH